METIIGPEYFDPSQSKLLERFREEAPGSYKHSVNVANICETIAIELNLDKELMKCAALYHDIGKITNPIYFCENQSIQENPHDNLDPLISTIIITKHISDGVMILFEENFPKEVIEIISQHHGNSVVHGFFNKAKRPKNIKSKFRYKSAKPQSTEAAILMIVDSVEATAKALYNINKENDDKFAIDVINSTIDRLTEDNQIDELKIGILKVVKKVLTKELESIYHKRVIYDNTPEDEELDNTDEKDFSN